MRRYCFLMLLLVASVAYAQESDTVAAPSEPNYSGFPEGRKVMTYLNFHQSVGYGLYRDLGTSPLTYSGGVIRSGFDVEIRMRKLRIAQTNSLIVGLYSFDSKALALETIGGCSENGVRMSFRAWEKRHWQLWVGASIDNYIGLKYNSNFSNSYLGLTDVLGIGLHGRMEFRTRMRPSGAHWEMHGELSVMPVAWTYRPGYSYVDNYSAGDEGVASTLFSNYEGATAWLPITKTDFGAAYVMRSGNKVGLSYVWSFLTTGKSGVYRFEEASHLLCVNLMVLL
ncbi:MAG: hypothetical protein IJU90_08360 [Bacteroidales bacterium]|nr:hypothetical protein [Bacteroidales bacterium]